MFFRVKIRMVYTHLTVERLVQLAIAKIIPAVDTNMSEQIVCHAQLQDQRKAAISMYYMHMTSLIYVAFHQEPVELLENMIYKMQKDTDRANKSLREHIDREHNHFPHVGVETYSSSTVECKFCGEALGWKCPDNPNGYCEYSQESDNQQDWETCIHCGNPEERK
jgi:hypothetical protein